MNKIKIDNIEENVFYLQSKDWKCGTEHKENIRLALVCEIIDMCEVDKAFDKESHPYFLNTNVVPHFSELNKEFLAETIKPDKNKLQGLAAAEMAYAYSGGVPVRITGTSNAEIDKKVKLYNAKTAGGSYKFETFENAENFVKSTVPEIAICIFGLIGFFLDKPWNQLGNDGWDVIKQQTENKEIQMFGKVK